MRVEKGDTEGVGGAAAVRLRAPVGCCESG
jgi:hypothetical protein